MRATDLARLAELHVSCLPDSIVSELGGRYAETFYEYLDRSPTEVLIVERDAESRIVGAGVVSMAPQSLNGRLLRQTPLLLHMLRRPARFARLGVRSILKGHQAPGQACQENLPELILLYVSPSLRSQGVGRRVVTKAEAELRQRGVSAYKVKTMADVSNPALAFYDSMGFNRSHLVWTLGMRFQVFRRKLGEDAADQARLT